MSDYQALADEVADQIRHGRLKPGERLPPQREFAFSRGIASSTASRVYAELSRRGLTSGEVGRGTFVRLPSQGMASGLAEPSTAPIDLESNFPILEGQDFALASLVRKLVTSRSMKGALRQVGATGTPQARQVASEYLRRSGFAPDPSQLLLTGGGRQAIAATFSALARPGERIGVEAISYAVVKGVAASLGINLVPIALDSEGLCPESLLRAHRETPLKGVYVQTSVHNPLGCTMSERRREQVASILRQEQLVAIEDGVYSFLADEPPLASFAPDRTLFLDSLSKRVAPGLTAGFIVAPRHLVEPIAAAVRNGGWGATGFAVAAAVAWMKDPASTDWIAAKRADARHRQQVARTIFGPLHLKGDERAYHLWLELPAWWRSHAFASAALRQGIAVTPGQAFAMAPGHAPNAVRLALASPPEPVLRQALTALAALARSHPRWGDVE